MPTSKHIRSILAAVRRADGDFSLIDRGDRIAVGLSGGKDSLSLLYALSLYGRFAGKDFRVYPVYLDLGFGNVDLISLKEFCASLGYELSVDDSRFVYDVLKAHSKKGKHLPCSICSRMKKAAINSMAKKLHCNKVAFAHHKDDAVETLFLNMIHGGKVATFVPKMELKKAGVTFIRPLIYCEERQLTNLARELGFPVVKSPCPADGHTDREKVKTLLKDIYGRFPDAERNFMGMLGNAKGFGLYFDSYELEEEVSTGYAIKPLYGDSIRNTPFAEKAFDKEETDFAVLFKHDPKAYFAAKRVLAHRYEIESLSGDEEALFRGITNVEARLGKKIIPLLLIMEKGHSKLAKKLGYIYSYEPTVGKACWHKRLG